jgi:hypothetical protein
MAHQLFSVIFRRYAQDGAEREFRATELFIRVRRVSESVNRHDAPINGAAEP